MARSRFLPVMLILATLTALALVAAVVSTRPSRPVAPGASLDESSRRTVQRFYEAANLVIATGDPAALDPVLAPEFAEPDGSGAMTSARPSLERSLLALHATVPALRLETEHLVGNGDRVVAIVRTDGVGAASIFGLDLTNPLWWSSVEIFRVADDRVVERAGVGEPPVILEPLAGARHYLTAPSRRSITAVHLSLQPGDRHRAPAVAGLRAVVVLVGAVEVTVEADGRLAEAEGSYRAALMAGERLILGDSPIASVYVAHNAGADPAILLEVIVASTAGSRDAASPYAEFAGAGIIAGGHLVSVPTGAVELAIGRATLPPGGRMTWAASPGPVLLGVERGNLELMADGPVLAWVRRQSGDDASYLPIATLATGDGGLLSAGTAVELRNAGDEPLEILIVTLLGTTEAPLTTG